MDILGALDSGTYEHPKDTRPHKDPLALTCLLVARIRFVGMPCLYARDFRRSPSGWPGPCFRTEKDNCEQAANPRLPTRVTDPNQAPHLPPGSTPDLTLCRIRLRAVFSAFYHISKHFPNAIWLLTWYFRSLLPRDGLRDVNWRGHIQPDKR